MSGKDTMMAWSVLPFGKYKGKTLPEIIARDPDWFFWMQPKFYGRLAKEAKYLERRARAIKIPGSFGKNVEVEIGTKWATDSAAWDCRSQRRPLFPVVN